MDEKELKKSWKKEEKSFFEGWDFSYLKNRWIDEEPSWDYMEMAKSLVRKSKSILDMETGGGERFSSLAPFPKHVVAFEGYKPNVAVARRRLRPFGIKVFEVTDVPLPFKDGEFDLILNRHGAINEQILKEVFRILKPKGIFLTQQVDGENMKDFMKYFGVKPKWPKNTLRVVRKNMKKIGFKIKKGKSWKGKQIFKDVGAIVYYLKAIPWTVDDFSVNKHFNILMKFQKKLEKGGELVFSSRRFFILAEK